VTREEYEAVVDFALDLGFENLFIQDVDEQNLAPDFDRAEPFQWEPGSGSRGQGSGSRKR
jgi:putative pyruvate formate lyase activating enzyme